MDKTYRVASSVAARRIPKNVVLLVKAYVDRLRRETSTPIERVIVYGSQARGKTHKWSDIDVCIVSPKFKHPMDAIAFLLQQRDDKEVMALLEPIGFSSKDFREGSPFIEEIKRTGVEILVPQHGDYTKLREKLFAGKDPETLDREIRKFNRQ